MTNFQQDYLELLTRDVQAEIDFLVRHGHEDNIIPEPCMFCVNYRSEWHCNRLKQLREFKRSISTQKVRKPIGGVNIPPKPELSDILPLFGTNL